MNAHTRTYALLHGYSVTFRCDQNTLFEACWSPDTPRIRKARQWRKLFDAYKAARREFLQEIAAAIGGNVLVVDTDAQITREVIHAPTQH